MPTTDEAIPQAITNAVDELAGQAGCEILTKISRVDSVALEYGFRARIKPREAEAFGYPDGYVVEFLVPEHFPYASTHTIPVEPKLRWYPHQNGDWALDQHANVMCPPSLNNAPIEESLLLYARHACQWISDALWGNLAPISQRYEFPHIYYAVSELGDIYVRGGKECFQWVSTEVCGVASVHTVESSDAKKKIALIRNLFGLRKAKTGKGPHLSCGICNDAFGKETMIGWAPWVYAGSPVAGTPHRAIAEWSELPGIVHGKLMQSARAVARLGHFTPIMLVGFSVPELWGGQPESIVWMALSPLEYGSSTFRKPPNFRDGRISRWPAVQRFVASNSSLRWLECYDVSENALTARAY